MKLNPFFLFAGMIFFGIISFFPPESDTKDIKRIFEIVSASISLVFMFLTMASAFSSKK